MGGGLRIATRLDQANYLANQQQLLDFAAPLPASANSAKMLGQKTILLSKLTCFDFSSSNFNLQGHILSTGGVALKKLFRTS
jgi:hypothetical protein